jgi:hypothetical protein
VEDKNYIVLVWLSLKFKSHAFAFGYDSYTSTTIYLDPYLDLLDITTVIVSFHQYSDKGERKMWTWTTVS